MAKTNDDRPRVGERVKVSRLTSGDLIAVTAALDTATPRPVTFDAPRHKTVLFVGRAGPLVRI